ncbi:MAG: phenylalanine--tRNA ligase subunit beta [Firmicutes bacterium]|nr:phenylalanine--tRNA ligase subunit beta [Bacillota bacterium]
MRVSYNWLKEYLPVKISAQELAEKMTFAGLEIDEVEERCQELSGVVVGKVNRCEKLEGSDHLHVCAVFDGQTEETVVCGAPNVAAGQTVAFAKVGATLPGGFTIGSKKTMGVESRGMLCSQKELGAGEDHTGIWLLPDDLPAGADLAETLGLKDQVLVVELTPNRADCLGVLNCAREAAALTGLPVTEPDLSYPEEGPDIQTMIDIQVDDPAICPRYMARLVTGVQLGPSPMWMQLYLLAAGMRPINNVVDIANYVMLEYNQPLHTFDYQSLRGKKILVREAVLGEELTTLDGKDRVFNGDEILICDGEGPVCLAGVMGGYNSEVTENTRDILIESACFEPVHIRRTARRLGIPSESSQRFEKGIDAASCDLAARRAAQLLVRYCGGTAAKGAVDVCRESFAPKRILLRRAKVNALLGMDYSMEEILQVMRDLSFGLELVAEEEEAVWVTAPTYRRDISIEEDLIEEVARLKGYDHIPATLPLNQTCGYRNREQSLELRMKELCAGMGLQETVNYSFISPKEAARLRLPEGHPWNGGLRIQNPLNEEQSVMRQSLLPGLLHAVSRNNSRRNLDVRLFEMGMVFVPTGGGKPFVPEEDEPQQPKENLHLGFAISGQAAMHWQKQSRAYDFFYLKGVVESLLGDLGISALRFQRLQVPYLHPGRAAEIYLDDTLLGYIGEVHPLTAAAYELENRTVVGELYMAPLFAAVNNIPQSHDLPRYPEVKRDIALLGDASVAAADIEAAIRNAGGPYLRKVELFDLYDGAPIPAGQRSLAYSLSFGAEERTLTDKEADESFAAIVEALGRELHLQLR